MTKGTHLIIDAWGCDKEVLSDPNAILTLLAGACVKAKATILRSEWHKFRSEDNLDAYSAIAILMESHISIHTWPEAGFASIDFYTCGDAADPNDAFTFIVDTLGADKVHYVSLPRGRPGNRIYSEFYRDTISKVPGHPPLEEFHHVV